METFCLIDVGDAMARWCVLGTNGRGDLVWLDFKSRQIPYAKGTVVSNTAGNDFTDAMARLPKEKVEIEQAYAWRFLLDPWSELGWLSPDGRLWGCRFFEHDDLAYALIRRSPLSLEQDGWIRVGDEAFVLPGDFHRTPTARQRATLEKLGFITTDPPGKKDPAYVPPDRNRPPPRYAVKPPEGVCLPREAGFKGAPNAEGGHRERSLAALVRRLGEYPLLRDLFAVPNDVQVDPEQGQWIWAIRWKTMSIGSALDADTLLDAEGLRFHRTSFDTIELTLWHRDGLHIDPIERRMIELAARQQPY